MTEIHAEAEDADAYFPTIKPDYWKRKAETIILLMINIPALIRLSIT